MSQPFALMPDYQTGSQNLRCTKKLSKVTFSILEAVKHRFAHPNFPFVPPKTRLTLRKPKQVGWNLYYLAIFEQNGIFSSKANISSQQTTNYE
jgi:hypothetical protein